jgi:hypothetical protein
MQPPTLYCAWSKKIREGGFDQLACALVQNIVLFFLKNILVFSLPLVEKTQY